MELGQSSNPQAPPTEKQSKIDLISRIGFFKNFGTGFGIKLAVALARFLLQKKTKPLKQLFSQIDSLRFPTFLGLFAGLFKGILCFLRHYRKTEDAYNALIAGFLAAVISVPICVHETRVTLAVYLFARSMESLVRMGVERGYLPRIPHFDMIIFVLMVPFMAFTLFYHYDTFAKGTEKSIFKLAQLKTHERKIMGLVKNAKKF